MLSNEINQKIIEFRFFLSTFQPFKTKENHSHAYVPSHSLFMIREQELIAGCIRQERLAQRQLYELFAGKLMVTAMRYMKNKADAEDVMQDSFIKIFKNLQHFRFDSPLDAWLRRIVANTALKALKKQPDYSQHIDSELVSDEIEQTDFTLSGFHFEQLMEMVNSLPDGCRTIFNLYAIEGYQHNEIAEMLGVSEGTSKSQFSRARMLLQQKINGSRQSAVSNRLKNPVLS